MKREWKPGDVAMIGIYPAFRVSNRDDTYFIDSTGLHWRSEDDNARPLAVIDPDDREQVERLVGLATESPANVWIDAFQRALREYADPTPPKPDEPQGLGAVVEDDMAGRWTRMGGTKHSWYRAHGHWSTYADIAAVRVLSEGVTA